MNAPTLIDHLRVLHVELSVSVAGKLHVEAPPGVLTDELRSAVTACRDELVAELSKSAETLSNKERDAALPLGVKASYCPTCHGRTVVVTPAADNLKCARCAPAWQGSPRRSRSANPSGDAP